jgi:hypothetical protein
LFSSIFWPRRDEGTRKKMTDFFSQLINDFEEEDEG